MTASALTARAQRKLARGQAILEAAFEEFVRNGFAAARLEDVADRAGLTKGALYLYYPSKDELFRAVIHDLSPDITSEFNMSVMEQSDPRARLEHFLRMVFARLVQDRFAREIIRLVITEGRRFPDLLPSFFHKIVAPAHQVAATIMADGVTKGVFRDDTMTLSPGIIVGAVRERVMMRMIFADLIPDSDEDWLNDLIGLVMTGVLAPDRR